MQQEQIVYVVDDDEGIREGLSLLLETTGQRVKLYSSAVDFLDDYNDKIWLPHFRHPHAAHEWLRFARKAECTRYYVTYHFYHGSW